MINTRLSVTGGQLRSSGFQTNNPNSGSRVVGRASPTPVTASSFAGGNTRADSTSFFGTPGFSTFLQGIAPDTSEQSLVPHYREIYYYDNVGGSAVDMKSTFPFSSHTLMGLESKELFVFSESLSRLNVRQLFQEISLSYLIDSAFVGSLVFDTSSRSFKDVLIHDYLSCQLSPKPFNSIDPLINVDSSAALNGFLNFNSDFTHDALAGYPQHLIDKFKSGAVSLDPMATLYVPRKGGRGKQSVSYLKRVLPIYLMDKALYRGNLVEAHRRQRATTHISAGDENWIPTDDELANILYDFQRTDQDPLGAWIVTRNGLQVNEVRPGGDFWKWSETFDIFTPYKLRALGISEAFLSGDASYSTAEAALSIFMQDADAYRNELTYSVMTNKVFPILAVLHGMYKDKSKAKDPSTKSGLLFNLTNHSNLRIPSIRWHKSLETQDTSSQMDALDKLSEKGFNIPLKMLAAASGVDITSLMTEMEEDLEIRKKFQALNDAISAVAPDTKGDGTDEDSTRMEFSALPRSLNAKFASRKKPLLSREFNDDRPIGVVSKSGNTIHAVANETRHSKKLNAQIVKASKALQDPHHRKQVSDKVRDMLTRN